MAKAKLDLVKAVNALDELADGYALATVDGQGRFKQALTVASGIQRLRQALVPEVMSHVMGLQGSPLGFRTDKDSSKGYPMEVVRDCLIEAVMRGAMPAGNEFNIISARTYLTKEFFVRAVGTYGGLTDLQVDLSIPEQRLGRTVVEFSAAWKMNGKDQSLKRTIPIRVNAGMGDDAILGKATRKGYAALYARLTGSTASLDGDVEDVRRLKDATPAPATGNRTEALAKQLEAPAPAPAPATQGAPPTVVEMLAPLCSDLGRRSIGELQQRVGDVTDLVGMKQFASVCGDLGLAGDWLKSKSSMRSFLHESLSRAQA